MTAPTWIPCRVTLGDLRPWAANPRLSTKAQAKRILASFQKFGQVLPVAIGPDNEVYDGHQRLSALLTVHGADYEIDARRASRPLTDDERRALVLTLHAGATGAWNWDDLAGWDAAQLQAGGLDADYLKALNTDALALRVMLESGEIDWPELDVKTQHIVTITYTLDDEPSLKRFVGQADDKPLAPVQTGKQILDRIKELTAQAN